MANEASKVLVHLYWPVADAAAAPLTPEALQRLPSYITRYAETLGAKVQGVGGMEDHLHVLLMLPKNKTLQSIEDELQRATQRFLRDVGSSRSFLWASAGNRAVGVSLWDRETVADYLTDNAARHASGDLWAELEEEPVVTDAAGSSPPADKSAGGDEEIPEWLRKAMKGES